MTFADNFEKSKNGHYFTMETMADFLTAVGKLELRGRNTKIYNVPCAFDIETTSTECDGMPCGIMYVFSFCLNGAVFIGRTYEDFSLLLDALKRKYHINIDRRLRIYVRNLGFEFQFIRKHFTWLSVYARQTRSPMSALTDAGFEFHCSLTLTNQKLEQTAKELINFPVAKLVGSLDYRLPRHYLTPLTDTEIQYSINDVLIDASMIYDRIMIDHNITRIPLTATGYTRKLCRNNCLPYNSKERWKYARNIARLTLTKTEYLVALMAFAGGFVHASPLSAMELLYYVASLDYTSAYPAGMVCEAEFPISKGIEIDCRKIVSRETLIDLATEFAFIGSFEFYNIESKTNIDYYISQSKTHNGKNIESFNGRVASADYFQICLTHIDFLTILKTYNIGGIRVLRLWQYRKGYLPKPYILTVLDQYGKKTQLKDVVGKEAEYLEGKRNTNSLYGMLVTQIDRPDVVYNDETQQWLPPQPANIDERISKYNNDQSRFLSYLWGIMVTAICRRNLWDAILTVGEDYHYSDTDSVKITNYETHKWYFDKYNDEIDAKMRLAAETVGFDYELTRPKTIKGIEMPLGQWHFEDIYTRAKFLNAKRYIYEQDGQLHVTIAGTGKNSTARYLLDTYGTIENVFENFDDGLLIKGEYVKDGKILDGTGKLTHIYNDNPVEFDLTDYTGRTAHVREESSVNLSPCDYAVGFPQAFLQFVGRLGNGIFVKEEIPNEIVETTGEDML